MKPNPTKLTYAALNDAYDFFNARLFSRSLPRCLITMQRRNYAYGYFAGGRFGSLDGEQITDEIALNPSHFRHRTARHILSTLVHEMVHLWQHHHGKPSRRSYHNRQWAARMRALGLIPSDTGAEGGKETGQRVSHYIEKGGPFDKASAELLKRGFEVPYVDLWGDNQARKKKAASKTRYTCPTCGLNAWAKPAARLICGLCEEAMQSNLEGVKRIVVVTAKSSVDAQPPDT
jgi:SprT-like family